MKNKESGISDSSAATMVAIFLKRVMCYPPGRAFNVIGRNFLLHKKIPDKGDTPISGIKNLIIQAQEELP
jgi:hypothetical protein